MAFQQLHGETLERCRVGNHSVHVSVKQILLVTNKQLIAKHSRATL